MTTRYERERAVALAALRQAATLCEAVRAELEPGVLAKSDKSPVTVADFGSQAIVARALAEAFLEDPLVAEEDSAALKTPEREALCEAVVRHVARLVPQVFRDDVLNWIDHGRPDPVPKVGRFWTLDPIDGTKGYLRGEQYAVALALIVDGLVEVGALACPGLNAGADGTGPRGALFAAVRGEGATVEPLDGSSASVPIHVRSEGDVASARFCESVESGHSAHGDSARLADHLGIRSEAVRMDSQAKYAVVARGEADIYLRLPTRKGYEERIWDHAAGALVVTEAGGQVSDIFGRPLDFRQGSTLAANKGVVVSGGPLHGRLIEALSSLGIAREAE